MPTGQKGGRHKIDVKADWKILTCAVDEDVEAAEFVDD